MRGPGLSTLLRDCRCRRGDHVRRDSGRRRRGSGRLVEIRRRRFMLVGDRRPGYTGLSRSRRAGERRAAAGARDRRRRHLQHHLLAAARRGCRRASSTPTTSGRTYGTMFASRVPDDARRAWSCTRGSLVFNGAFVTLMPALFLGAHLRAAGASSTPRRSSTTVRARAGHARDDGAVADRRDAQRARLLAGDSSRRCEMLCSRRRAAAPRAQGAAARRAAGLALRAVRPHRGIHHRPRPRRLRAQARFGRQPPPFMRDAHRRRRRRAISRRARSARSSGAARC